MAQQKFVVPNIDSLLSSVDNYYNSLSSAQIEEFKQQNKYHWLAYLPQPGYSPFTGGFSFSLNLSAPLTEINNRNLSKQKSSSIIRLNKLIADDLKNQIIGDYEAIEIAIYEFNLEDSLEFFKDKAFKLILAQYERSEIAPSELLAQQQGYQSYKLQRTIAADNIKKSITQIFIKSKTVIAANDNGFNKISNHDKDTTAKDSFRN